MMSRALLEFAQALRPCAAKIWESMLTPSRGRNHMIHNNKTDSARATKRAEFWHAANTRGETYQCSLVLL